MAKLKEGPNEKLNITLRYLIGKCGSINKLCGVLDCSRTQIHNCLSSGSTSLAFALTLDGMIAQCDKDELSLHFNDIPTWRDFAVERYEKIDAVIKCFIKH